MKAKRTLERQRLLFTSCNVQSLVERTGDARICRKVPSAAKRVDRGLDIFSEELRKFEIAVAGRFGRLDASPV